MSDRPKLTLAELKKRLGTQDIEELAKCLGTRATTVAKWGDAGRQVPHWVRSRLDELSRQNGGLPPDVDPLERTRATGLTGRLRFHADFDIPAEMLDRWDPSSRTEAFRAYRALVQGRRDQGHLGEELDDAKGRAKPHT